MRRTPCRHPEETLMLYSTRLHADAAARAERDYAALNSIGITTDETFYPPGTELISIGKEFARRERAEFLELPSVEDGMAMLHDAVLAEDRRDHFVDLGSCYVDL